MKKYYQLLEIDINATTEDVNRAYRDLVMIWHPDKVNIKNPRLREKAEEKMKQLNEARNILLAHIKSKYDERKRFEKERFEKEKAERESAAREQADRERVERERDRTERVNKEQTIVKQRVDKKGKRNVKEYPMYQTPKPVGSGWPAGCLITVLIFSSIILVFSSITWLVNSVNRQEDRKPNSLNSGQSSGPESENKKLVEDPKEPREKNEKSEEIAKQFNNTENEYSIRNWSDLNKSDIISLQENLANLNYYNESIDGKIGPNTINGSKSFCKEFLTPREYNADQLLELIEFHGLLAKRIKNWKNVFLSGTFRNWIEQFAEEDKLKIKNIFNSGNVDKIERVINSFEFYINKPPPLARPKTSVLHVFNAKKSQLIAPLKIITKDHGHDFYLKISNIDKPNQSVIIFIESGQQINTNVPLGRFNLKYASGSVWFGEKYFFGNETAFNEADEIFEFRQIGNSVSGYTIELYLQQDGNLSTPNISKWDF